MSLRFITGKTGSGKTAFCMNEITKGTRDINYIYIVPEQFSMESEIALTRLSGSKALLNKMVFSFRHLARQMISKYGMDRKIFGDTGKNMLLIKLSLEYKDSLHYYTKSFDKDGFINQLSATISEFMQYGITASMIDEKISDMDNESLKLKLSDLSVIYNAYVNYVENEFISGDTILDVLCSIIEKCDIIKGSCIWIDGFNSFTPQEHRVIGELLRYAEQVTICLSVPYCDITADSLNIFDPYFETKSTIRRIVNAAEDMGVRIEKTVFLNDDLRHINSPVLSFLRNNYLSFKHEVYDKSADDIAIYSADDMYAEINNVCINIRSLVMGQKMCYGDIAVIIGSDSYLTPLRTAMQRYDIPCYGDSKKPAVFNRLTQFIINAVDTIAYNFSSESIFAMLKTGFIDIDNDDVYLLENYVLENGIKGYHWKKKEWTRGFGKYSRYDSNDINGIKDSVLEYLSPLTDKIDSRKKYTITQISRAVYDFLFECEIPKSINDIAERYRNDNNNEAADEYGAIWGLITDVFEKMCEILGENVVTPVEYSKILKSGFSVLTIGQAPPTQDNVLIGDIERTRLNNIKVLFILGVNEGVMPPYHEDIGAFSDTERRYISANCFELAPDNKAKINRDRYLIYNCLCRPSNMLVLSFSRMGTDGGDLKPSGVISKICDMFPHISVLPAESKPNAPVPVFEWFLQEGRKNNNYDRLMRWFLKSDEYSLKISNIRRALLTEIPAEYLSKEAAKLIFGDELHLGVTSLEEYTKCPFSFFIKYGLKARERREFKISTPDIGNIFHLVLEDFSKKLKESNTDWRNLSREQISSDVGNCVDMLADSYAGALFKSTARFRRLTDRIKKMAAKSIWAMSEHIKSGRFEPYEYEVGFGPGEKLPPIVYMLENGTRLILTGKTDRVDVMEKDGTAYVKIIDYKSYDMEYSLSSVYYGLQMQLSLYMSEFLKNGNIVLKKQDVKPGGMFYFKIDDPYVKASIDSDSDAIDKAQLNNFSMSGMLLNNSDVLRALDSNTGEENMPKLKDISSVKSNTVLVNDDEFRIIMEYVNNMVVKTGTEISDGRISVKPYKQGKKTACTYCVLRSICRFEDANMPERYNVMQTIKKDGIMDKFKSKD